jgi:hypothetical protein
MFSLFLLDSENLCGIQESPIMRPTLRYVLRGCGQGLCLRCIDFERNAGKSSFPGAPDGVFHQETSYALEGTNRLTTVYNSLLFPRPSARAYT